MKLDTIIENQQKLLALLWKVLVNTKDPDTECTEERLVLPCDSVEELEGERMEKNTEFAKKMVIWGLIFSYETVIVSITFIYRSKPQYASYKYWGTCRIILRGGGEHVVLQV
ncbi:hypothetical protein CHS0354_014348 [Potamilus streckersoni]|uniref:Uncharacterized protein n=1 Tax=Potamilus streckersoni TaxID=2493646 RepID=A0AAE0VYM8_9BIVA|nr:hypothetical protein CHS0354_014348 [Potamilus streckersoni]